MKTDVVAQVWKRIGFKSAKHNVAIIFSVLLCAVALFWLYPSRDGDNAITVKSGTFAAVSCPLHPSDITDDDVRQMIIPTRPFTSALDAWLKPDATRYGPAPRKIPDSLLSAYTLNGSIPTLDNYFDQADLGEVTTVNNWTVDTINDLRQKVRNRVDHFSYVNVPLYEALEKHRLLIEGQHGLVVGSQSPWLESMLLEFGASSVSTLEFGKITSEHPQISTFRPKEFISGFLAGKIKKSDFAFTYSSIEHDGLGRYGDILNPDGDLQTMYRLMHFVKPGGFVFVGVPCCHDLLVWNAHRIYGPLRLARLFAGYRVIGIYPHESGLTTKNMGNVFDRHPVWVLQNRLGCSDFPESTVVLPAS